MKKWLALAACLVAVLLAAPVFAEPGDEPCCPWEHMPYQQVLELEELREKQVVGGVTGSPYWLWQAYLGSGSLDIRLYDVSDPIFPKQLLFKERVRFAGYGDESKVMTLTAKGESEAIELRIDRLSLAKLEQAGISSIVLRSAAGEQAYACADIAAIMDYVGVTDSEILCLQGEDAPLYKYCEDGIRRAISIQ